jgi:hypothetical protein
MWLALKEQLAPFGLPDMFIRNLMCHESINEWDHLKCFPHNLQEARETVTRVGSDTVALLPQHLSRYGYESLYRRVHMPTIDYLWRRRLEWENSFQ